MKFSLFSKWMYRTWIIRNLFNSSRAVCHKWLKWRSYSPFTFMLFCNLTPLDGRFVNANVFCRKSEFCKYITSLHIQHCIYVRQFEFFVFTMRRIASLFCNLSFAGQYILSADQGQVECWQWKQHRERWVFRRQNSEFCSCNYRHKRTTLHVIKTGCVIKLIVFSILSNCQFQKAPFHHFKIIPEFKYKRNWHRKCLEQSPTTFAKVNIIIIIYWNVILH